ncbi:adenine deaminase [Metabacillus iocasae]|uniref:Adenine deaminase n=1 Tax=Priestia iocasae TaxID=2291674 RepID=A0ABS2R0P0_9BACI|nr:adenine deaminase [Metabacillus iocasae]MBM7704314.1 adenine deaminase [Metabacillus iocasae]
MNKTFLQKQISAANKQIPVDLVIKNGKIIDVFTLSIMEGDLAIHNGQIVGIGDYEGVKTIDAKGKYVSPTFIDGHVHIESSMVTPREFAKLVVPHGVTAVITDPHEIANVAGADGIQFMLDDSENLPLDVFVNLPSSVPATPFENAGAILRAEDLEAFLSHPRVLGLAEVMDFPSVRDGADDMLDKLMMAKKQGRIIDGHGAGLDATGINIYRTAGITTDHECIKVEEALDRVKRGMYVLIREGSVAKDLKQLLPAVTERNARRFLFCTDDKHLDDLLTEGSIDHNIRLAIQEGLDPLIAIQMASLNAAECYGLEGKGAIAPGYDADFVLLNDLHTLQIDSVYKDGTLVAQNHQLIYETKDRQSDVTPLLNSVKLPALTTDSLQLPISTGKANIIEIIPNSLVTNHLIEQVDTQNGFFQPSIQHDQLKMAVIERHHLTGNIGLGIVKGFELKSGAIATTIAHDSHNIVAVGTNDEDLLLAVQTIHEIGGGIVIVKEGRVLHSLQLSIGGLMATTCMEEVNDTLTHVHDALHDLHITDSFNPLLTLSFLSLPVIPALKLTDKGLFNVQTFEHISVEA